MFIPVRPAWVARARRNTLENVLQRELDNSRVKAGGRNLAERPRCPVGKAENGSLARVWVGELGMVEGVEKFRPELHGLPLRNAGGFQSRHIPVELPRPKQD